MPALLGRLLTRPGGITGIFLSLLLLWVIGCRERPTDLIRVEAQPAGDATRLSLLPAPGVRINAVFKPVLELRDGTVHRFDSPHVTPDSAYFTALPELTILGRPRGLVTASVCPEGLALCRVVQLEL